MAESDLTARQKLFVEEYAKDRNATQACIRAGYSKKGANVTGSQLLANPNIAAAIQRAVQAVTAKNGITQEWVIGKLAAIAGTDMKDIASWNESGMRWKDSSELSPAAHASIQAIEQVMNEHGGTIKVKQYDRISALKLLGQHLGMFKEQSEVKLTVERPAQELSDDELEKAMKDRTG